MYNYNKLLHFNFNILKHLRFTHTQVNAKTIYALSSGHGKCGVAVIRVSGPDTKNALRLMTALTFTPKPREAYLKSIKNPYNGEVIDKGLILWFPGPNSFTGEDCCEFQIHGGLAVITALLNALGSIKNLQLAKPGEFTRRAFYNNKLDLTEVEGLADLLQAETEAQRKQAFLQTQGSLSKLYNNWREILIKCIAHIEAHIDFDETDTIELNLIEQVSKNISNLKTDINKHIEDGCKGERLRNGVRTVILGEPNVGKSSLLNALCKRPAAIVTPIEGTTRDILDVTLDINGYPLILTDTAGLRLKTKDIIEQEGIRRALNLYEEADLIIIVIDYLKYVSCLKKSSLSLLEFLKLHIKNLQLNKIINENNCDLENLFNKDCVIIFNKIDLAESGDNKIVNNIETNNIICMSCKTETGFNKLVDVITSKLKVLCGEPTKEHPSMNQARHKQHLIDCVKNLNNFLEQVSVNNDIVLIAENLRKALRNLGKLTGNVTTEQLLDVIFKDFCIGK